MEGQYGESKSTALETRERYHACMMTDAGAQYVKADCHLGGIAWLD